MFNILPFFGIILLATTLVSCTKNNKTIDAPAPPIQNTQAHVHPEAHAHHDETPTSKSVKNPAPTPYTVELSPLRPLTVNSPSNIELRILNQSGSPVKHKNFRVMHGRRVHTLIIDPSLQDYQHIHMRPDDFNGSAVYEFTFLPREAGLYKLYLDVVDQKNKHYYLESSFEVPGTAKTPAFDPKLTPGNIQAKAESQGLTFTMQSDGPIRAQRHVMLNITVKRGEELFRQLEPTMQAYAHLVGFNADRTKLIHAHPMGDEPRSSNQRGGPNLKFGVDFPASGKYRLFLQVQINGKDVFVPIDVNVL